MSFLKKWNGSSHVDINPKRWSGSSWVNAEAYKWDGSKWVNMTSQKYTTTWDATWTQTYRENGTKRTDYRSSKLCQGEYLSDPWGLMRSLCGFGDIASTLAGSVINDVQLYLKNEHWYYYAGGKAVIGYHNHSSEPTNFSHSKYGAKTESFSARGQARWIDMPNALAEGIRDGDYKGVSLYSSSNNMNYYGIFYGAGDGSSKPKLKITYTK